MKRANNMDIDGTIDDNNQCYFNASTYDQQ